MIDEPLTPHERALIEQVRKVNKLLSLYVLAIQERKPLIADENSRLAQALRSVADTIEREGTQVAGRLPANAQPVIEGSIGKDPAADDTTAEG